MVRMASRRGVGAGGSSGGSDSVVPMLIRSRHVLLATILVVIALLAFAVMDDPAVTLIYDGIIDAIGDNATAFGAPSAAASGSGGGLHSVRGAAAARGNGDTDTTNAEANDEAASESSVHKVAGLSCAKYGGPPDEIAAEMVYWRDILPDATYVSPFKSYGPQKKYLTFEPDEGGWNNIRMSMETVVAFAHAMGRTLVMPPEQKVYLLGETDGKNKNSFSFSDFFHFESVAAEHPGVEVISTQEFLEREIVSGNIRHPQTGEMLMPPDNKTDWDGIGTYHSKQFKKLAKFLQTVGITSTWACDQCIATFPSQPGPFTSGRLEAILKDILAEGDSHARQVSFDDNPTPVDAPAKDRMKEMLAHRQNLCIYNNTLQSAPVMHFTGGGEYRLLVHFYAFMFFEDYLQDLWTKRFVRDHLRYVDEIQCAAARVVAAIRKKARSNGAADGAFDTFHIRRGDFQYKDTRLEADEIYNNVKHLLNENTTIYIATDEKNSTFFDPLRRHYNLYFLRDFAEEIGDINKNFYGMMDQRIASRGRNFFGTYYSTFSGYITRMKGYHSQVESENAVKTGQSSSYYFVPKHFIDSVHGYMGIHGPFWAREFPVSWRDIDKGIEELSKTGGKMFVAAAR